MSPELIHIILNYYAIPAGGDRENGFEYTVFRKFVSELKGIGLIGEDGEITPMGKAYVDMLCSTPLPLNVFVDPRFHKESKSP